jgi:hypothetical protein
VADGESGTSTGASNEPATAGTTSGSGVGCLGALGIFAIGLLVGASALVVAERFENDQEHAIPTSCREPEGIDHSPLGLDYGPYTVELSVASDLFGRNEEASALIGHGESGESAEIIYGFPVDLQSLDIEDYRCRWTVDGVAIIEPRSEHPDEPGIEHFVPAQHFLGGR